MKRIAVLLLCLGIALLSSMSAAASEKIWISEKEPVTDYSYSFAVVGDTQIIADAYPDQFGMIYEYILENINAKKIKFVMGLGDITNLSAQREWTLAKEHIFKLNGKVPYLLNRGNHDTRSGFNDTFQGSVYENQIMGRYDEGVENTWQSISVNGQKYLIMALDYGARYNVLTWASEVIEQHPDHNVIITTHAYLNEDGTTLDSKEADCPPISEGYSTGELMWNQFVKKHENIVLVLCGHISSDKIVVTQTKGEHGNTVTQMLINPQDVDIAHGPTGLVSMFYFSADGKSLQVEYYSTVKQQYFLPENQFTVTLDVVDPSKVVNPISSSTEQTSSSKKQTSSVIDKPSSVPQQNSSNQISKTPASVFDIVSMQDSFATISKDMTSSNIPSDITVDGTSSNSDNNGSSKINVWLIIGIVLSIVIIATGGAVGMICWKKKPPRKSPPKW